MPTATIDGLDVTFTIQQTPERVLDRIIEFGRAHKK